MNGSGISTVRDMDDTSRTARLPLTEEELLDQEEQWARQGLRVSLSEAKEDLRGLVDLPTHVRRHPVLALIASVAAGFAMSGPLAQVVRRHGGALATLAIGSRALKGVAASKLIEKLLRNLPFAPRLRPKQSRDPLQRLFDSLRL